MTDAMSRHCQACGAPLNFEVADLGDQPPANRFLTPDQAKDPRNEPKFPLALYACDACGWVQITAENRAEDIFVADYAYFSSFAPSWVAHAKRYTDMVIERFGLDAKSQVVEVASNDGYLLQHFVARGIPVLGVDPAGAAAEAAKEKGVETVVDFFGSGLASKLAAERGAADLVLGNNVTAHVPDINDFVAGLKAMIKPDGWVTLEFPHLLRLIDGLQFDTIYDEHFSYISLSALKTVAERQGLVIVDVEELPTHGGSLRVFLRNAGEASDAVRRILEAEDLAGLLSRAGYEKFATDITRICDDFRAYVAEAKAQGKTMAAFGAAAKGNTFLNTCGIDHATIQLVADDTPMKQGKVLPGSHVPVVPVAELERLKPDIIFILPWNLRDEIIKRLAPAAAWGATLVTAIPEIREFKP